MVKEEEEEKEKKEEEGEGVGGDEGGGGDESGEWREEWRIALYWLEFLHLLLLLLSPLTLGLSSSWGPGSSVGTVRQYDTFTD